MKTKKTSRSVRVAALLMLGVVSSVGLAGCDFFAPRRGPLEQAGHDIDHAAQDVQHDVVPASH